MTGTNDTDALIHRSLSGDKSALSELFSRHRPRLKKMVSLRMDRRLAGRVNASGVLRKVLDELPQRLPEYQQEKPKSFFLWLRMITAKQLAAMHRRFLESVANIELEVRLYRGRLPPANSVSLAAQLLGNVVSLGEMEMRTEMQVKLQEVLNALEPADREILALKHFEELDNTEISEVLGIDESVVGKRYIRALRRLREALPRDPRSLHE